MSLLRQIFHKPCDHYMVLDLGIYGRVICDRCGAIRSEWRRL
jgi:hypothetical protein